MTEHSRSSRRPASGLVRLWLIELQELFFYIEFELGSKKALTEGPSFNPDHHPTHG